MKSNRAIALSLKLLHYISEPSRCFYANLRNFFEKYERAIVSSTVITEVSRSFYANLRNFFEKYERAIVPSTVITEVRCSFYANLKTFF
ncbi:hypothetical protein QUB70_07430 [Microcoleus sp. A003_D6]|uniref:hypothetical protein n=1 Tax=Microcoleus sp. A003_D6 TaxID=3055266 RepID=UPI002FD278D0